MRSVAVRWGLGALVLVACARGAPSDPGGDDLGGDDTIESPAPDADPDCRPDCTGRACGEIEPCGTTCGSPCDVGCVAHCTNDLDDCDETGVDCGGATCGACGCTPSCAGYACGAVEPTCGAVCGSACDAGCTAHCGNGAQDCDETGVDCGGATCGACTVESCGMPCYGWDGSSCWPYVDACDGCDLGCWEDDPDCDAPGSTCLDQCPCLLGYSSWYCDGWDDCADPSCECAGE